MALQTREVHSGRSRAAPRIIERAAENAFRNKRPLALAATGMITAVDYLATGTVRPDLALLFNTYCSMRIAGDSLEAHARLEKEGYRNSSFAMLSAGLMDIFNMGVSFVPFLSKVYGSGDNMKNGVACMALLGVTALAAQGIEQRARFVLLREKFWSPFQHMGIPECVEYLRELEKRERSWWRKPYWMLNPGKLEEIREEKMKVSTYMGDRMRSKSL